MDPIETVTSILQSAPGEAFCDPCLAFALEMPLVTIQDIRNQLVTDGGDYARHVGPCGNCSRVTGITQFKGIIGVDAPAAREPNRLRKCIRCSRRVSPDDEEIVNGDLFHRQCWSILRSQSRIADSRQMTRLTHLLVRNSRARLDPGREDQRKRKPGDGNARPRE